MKTITALFVSIAFVFGVDGLATAQTPATPAAEKATAQTPATPPAEKNST